NLLRVPEYRPGHEISTRIEYRAPDPACNPYLAFAAILAAGLEGIEREYPLPPSPDAGKEHNRGQEMPGSLYEAIEHARRSRLLPGCLGRHVFDSLIENKEKEWVSYRSHITDYELKRYLPIL